VFTDRGALGRVSVGAFWARQLTNNHSGGNVGSTELLLAGNYLVIDQTGRGRSRSSGRRAVRAP
jgi:hypothetical protein